MSRTVRINFMDRTRIRGRNLRDCAPKSAAQNTFASTPAIKLVQVAMNCMWIVSKLRPDRMISYARGTKLSDALEVWMGPENDVQPLMIYTKRANQMLSLNRIRAHPGLRPGQGPLRGFRLQLPSNLFNLIIFLLYLYFFN